MFDNFKKEEIGNLGEIIGGRATKSETTGWFYCDTGWGKIKLKLEDGLRQGVKLE